jgi:integrase
MRGALRGLPQNVQVAAPTTIIPHTTLHLPGERTKNKRPHDVPLSKQAQEILKRVPKISNVYVFVNGRNITTSRKASMGNFSLLKSQLDLLMLDIATKDRNEAVTILRWQVHDLRRTVSTSMNSLKILPHVVEPLLNHISTGAKAGVAGTYNRYTYDDEKRDAVDRWGNYVENIVSGRDLRNVVPLRR